ncbi:MAG: OmpA family protein [Marinifilaceae bacterium]
MRRYLLLIFLVFMICAGGMSQTIMNRKGDKAYEKFNYKRAVEFYENSLAIDSTNVHVIRRLANAYDKIGEFRKGHQIYRLLMENDFHRDSDLLNYAFFVKKRGEYREALNRLEQYLALHPSDRKAREVEKEVRKILQNPLMELNCEVKLMDCNSEYSDFAPVVFQNQLVFTSGRKGDPAHNKKYGWDGQYFLGLFQYDLDGESKEVVRFAKEVGSRYHEGVISFSPDRQKMYLTSNNNCKGKLRRSKQGINNLKIFISELKDGKWEPLQEFVHNNDEFSVGHPALSSDGRKMYFVSNMPGGFGGTDIYFCSWVEGGWTVPENMGPEVNSSQNEMFPFVDQQGNLFFASNGHSGLGGLDLYGINPNDPQARLIHLGPPINSEADDFSMVFHGDGARGFFASNRAGGMGRDDIYAFEIDAISKVKVELLDSLGQNPGLANQIIVLGPGEIEPEYKVEENCYRFNIESGHSYRLLVKKDSFYSIDTVLYSHLLEPELTHSVKMRKLPVEPERTVNFVLKDFISGDTMMPDVFQIVEPEIVDLKQEMENGNFTVQLKSNIDYRIFAQKDGYYALDTSFYCPKNSNVLNQELAMRVIPPKEEEKEFLPEELTTVYFEFDRYEVKNKAFASIAKVIDILKEEESLMVTLVARADTRGRTEYNQNLAFKRAMATRDFFLQKGIEGDRVVVLALGESAPFEQEKDQSLETWYQLNRCVDFELNTIFQTNTVETEILKVGSSMEPYSSE